MSLTHTGNFPLKISVQSGTYFNTFHMCELKKSGNPSQSCIKVIKETQ